MAENQSAVRLHGKERREDGGTWSEPPSLSASQVLCTPAVLSSLLGSFLVANDFCHFLEQSPTEMPKPKFCKTSQSHCLSLTRDLSLCFSFQFPCEKHTVLTLDT